MHNEVALMASGRSAEIHAARDDEVKRPINSRSSLAALEEKERDEDIQNEAAIAAVIAEDIEQARDNPDCKSSSATGTTLIKSTPVSVPTWWVTFYDIPGADQLPDALQYLCLAYADYLPEAKRIYQYPATIGITFFSRYVSQIQHHLESAANEFLTEGKIDMALALVRVNGKEVLNVPTQGRDRFGTRIEERTLLQMAGMMRDVNLRKKKAKEKEDHGAVELLAQAARLATDEVKDQLFPVLFSDEAKRINEARKNRVLTVLIEFAENILKRKADLPKTWNRIEEFNAAQAKCQPELNKLRKDLLGIVSDQTITAGYILDSHIIVELAQWFNDLNNLKRFGGLRSLVSDLFWVSSYGLLQYIAPACDAHIHGAGIGDVVDNGVIPARTLKNSDASSHFLDGSGLSSGLIFLDYQGFAGPLRGQRGAMRWGMLDFFHLQLCRTKTEILQNLCNAQTVQPQR